jgi:hypothetical protein
MAMGKCAVGIALIARFHHTSQACLALAKAQRLATMSDV